MKKLTTYKLISCIKIIYYFYFLIWKFIIGESIKIKFLKYIFAIIAPASLFPLISINSMQIKNDIYINSNLNSIEIVGSQLMLSNQNIKEIDYKKIKKDLNIVSTGFTSILNSHSNKKENSETIYNKELATYVNYFESNNYNLEQINNYNREKFKEYREQQDEIFNEYNSKKRNKRGLEMCLREDYQCINSSSLINSQNYKIVHLNIEKFSEVVKNLAISKMTFYSLIAVGSIVATGLFATSIITANPVIFSAALGVTAITTLFSIVSDTLDIAKTWLDDNNDNLSSIGKTVTDSSSISFSITKMAMSITKIIAKSNSLKNYIPGLSSLISSLELVADCFEYKDRA